MEYGNIEGQGSITPLPADFNITSQADGTILYFNGTSWVILAAGTADQVLTAHGASAPTWEAAAAGGLVIEEFTASGTFTAPSGITRVYLSMVGGGGGGQTGGSGSNGSGGGGAAMVISFPFTVIPGNDYTVTIGAGGAAGASPAPDGGTTSFDSLDAEGGGGGVNNVAGGGRGGFDAADTATTVGGLSTLKGGDGDDGQVGTGGGGTLFGRGANTQVAAAANTGAGGGGHINGIGGGAGGSGLVIVMY